MSICHEALMGSNSLMTDYKSDRANHCATTLPCIRLPQVSASGPTRSKYFHGMYFAERLVAD